MVAGNTITTSLNDAMDSVVSSARVVREKEGVMPQLVDKKTLGIGIGNTWEEISWEALTAAQAITETTVLTNPQQYQVSLKQITPTMVGLETFVTDKVAQRLSPIALAEMGGLMQNAAQRKKNADGLVVLDSASTSLGGAGVVLNTGYITAAKAQIKGNSTEQGNPPYRYVGHSYQIKCFEDEIIASVGTYPVADGLTARVFTEGFSGKIGGVEIYADDNLSIDSSDDAKGGVFAQEGIVMVQGSAPRIVSVRQEHIGGGGTSVYLYDDYAYGTRSTYWVIEIYGDCTAPTS